MQARGESSGCCTALIDDLYTKRWETIRTLPHPCSILMRLLAVNIELDLESSPQQALHVSCLKVDPRQALAQKLKYKLFHS